MANGDGRKSPFDPSGRGGATGNDQGGAPRANLGANLPQKMGSGRNPTSVPAGGPVLKLDPPGDRGQQLGTFSDEAGNRRPFRLDGSATPAGEDATDDGGGPVGGVPGEDSEGGDGGSD
jgi:hypothetical protein